MKLSDKNPQYRDDKLTRSRRYQSVRTDTLLFVWLASVLPDRHLQYSREKITSSISSGEIGKFQSEMC